MAEKQKLRSEIDELYKWDLTKIYSSENLFKECIEETKKEINEIEKYKEIMMDTAQNLYETLHCYYETSRKLEKLYMYAHLHHDEDTSNTKYQDYVGIILKLFKSFEQSSAYITPRLLKSEYSSIEEFYLEYPKLKEYEINIKDTFRYKNHTLTDNEEKIVSTLSKALSSPSSIFSSLTDTDITFGIIKDEQEKEIELTDSNYSVYIKSNDRRVRKDAFKLMYETYKKYENTIAGTLAANVEANSSIASIYNYKSSIESSLYNDSVSIEVYNNLIKTVSDNMNVLFKYYRIKKEILGLEEFHLYDIYTSVIEGIPKKYDFNTAKELVIDALSVLGEEYIKDLNKAFDESWIDIYNNKGKRTGAYSSGSYDTNPYLLLNYEGTLNDVSTLAHELGHSMHTYYSNQNNSYQNSSYKIFVAEVASTVNELLLAFSLLEKTEDKNEKLIILNNLLDLFKATIYRQTMFAEFEKEIYARNENNETLTHELLSNIYYKLNEKYFGDTVELDEEIKYEWERVPHFYYNFYVYKYATGLSAACHIVENILGCKPNAKENYLKFLKLGGSMEPIEELKVTGVDMNKKEVVESAIKMFDKLIDEFYELYRS